MNCKDINKAIVKYGTDSDIPGFKDHISGCSRCKRLVNMIDTTIEKGSKSSNVEPDPFLFTRIEARMEKSNQKRPQLKLANYLVVATVIFAVSVFSGILVGNTFTDTPNNVITSEAEMNEYLLFEDLDNSLENDILLTDNE
jgi:hypothetical protein